MGFDWKASRGAMPSATRIDASSYAGDFDITFSDSNGSVVGHLTGSFNANLCAALGPTIGGTCI